MADEEQESGGFLDRIKESPRTVSALIIILIVAAAIYAFSGDTNQQPDDGLDLGLAPATEETQNGETPEAGEETATPGDQQTTTETTPTPVALETVTPEQLQQQSQALQDITREEQAYVVTAQTGDGVTHLARRATTRWLAENSAGYNVTNEHRIYIEDYIQNRVGTQGLALGETRTISFDLIQEAVQAAGQLNESQLRNLSQYTHAL